MQAFVTNEKGFKQILSEIENLLKKEGLNPVSLPAQFIGLLKNWGLKVTFDLNDGRSFKIDINNNGIGTISATVTLWRNTSNQATILYDKKIPDTTSGKP